MRTVVLLALAAVISAAAQKKAWTQPRTPDGQPDIQGIPTLDMVRQRYPTGGR